MPLLLIIGLSGCGANDPKPNQDIDRAKIVHDQVGRFLPMPAASNLPPMILDTATGCVMALNRAQDGSVALDEVPIANSKRSCMELRQIDVVYNGFKIK
jgi:hypothetical protein